MEYKMRSTGHYLLGDRLLGLFKAFVRGLGAENYDPLRLRVARSMGGFFLVSGSFQIYHCWWHQFCNFRKLAFGHIS